MAHNLYRCYIGDGALVFLKTLPHLALDIQDVVKRFCQHCSSFLKGSLTILVTRTNRWTHAQSPAAPTMVRHMVHFIGPMTVYRVMHVLFLRYKRSESRSFNHATDTLHMCPYGTTISTVFDILVVTSSALVQTFLHGAVPFHLFTSDAVQTVG